MPMARIMVDAAGRVLFTVFLCIVLVDGLVRDDEIVVRIIGGERAARDLADSAGYLYKGRVRNFYDTYVLVPLEDVYPMHQKRGMLEKTKRLVVDKRVLWVDPQITKKRYKRDFYPDFNPFKTTHTKDIRRRAIKRPPPPNFDRTFNDELWTQEWYLHDTRTRADLPKLDLNVLPLYRLGITGRGVRVNILDDGIEYTHQDLKNNYDPEISWDCNEDDDDPLPRYEKTKQNSHGTRCAGEVAMSANNGKCGVGIAFNAKVGGVKLLDGLVNDRIEGTALGHAFDKVDIYSASWGPNDDGKTVDGPGRLAREALIKGINEGRGGRGSIYVWASGNGGSQGDNCNCDGYLASPYTISIGSASQRGEFPWYGEACASTLAVTYSSGAYQDQMIATTDLHNECTIKHTGTSASAPLAAGIIALALEVNPELTWRDVQHLIVWTSELAPVADNPGWQMNGAGLWTNTRFGFGLMNAFSFVMAAANWTRVPPKTICKVKSAPIVNKTFAYGNPISIPITTTGCMGTRQKVQYLEHVEVTTNQNYTKRGALEIHLISPEGTKVQILGPRKRDDSQDGFIDWTFMSVMTWGENVAGVWFLQISDNVGPEGNLGSVGDTVLSFHGTVYRPEHMKYGPRAYNHEYNRVRNHIDYKKNMLDDMEENSIEWNDFLNLL